MSAAETLARLMVGSSEEDGPS